MNDSPNFLKPAIVEEEELMNATDTLDFVNADPSDYEEEEEYYDEYDDYSPIGTSGWDDFSYICATLSNSIDPKLNDDYWMRCTEQEQQAIIGRLANILRKLSDLHNNTCDFVER